MTEREEIYRLEQQRQDARLALKSDGQRAKELLKPSAIFSRWKTQQMEKLSNTAERSKAVAKKSAPFIGGAAAGAFLFATRKPILNAMRKLRNKER